MIDIHSNHTQILIKLMLLCNLFVLLAAGGRVGRGRRMIEKFICK